MKRLFVLLLLGASAHAQQLPNTDIYMMDIDGAKQNQLSLLNMTAVATSQFYENQPQFVGNQGIVFTRDNGKNTDIWQWRDGQLSVLSETEESEYSPTPLPGDFSILSTVRVEADGTQRLWRRTSDGNFDVLLHSIKPVGYHVWQKDNLGLFVLGEPHRLEVALAGEQQSTVIDNNIGRCLQRVPASQAISYTVADTVHQLKIYDFSTGEKSLLGSLPEGAQDYLWLSDRRLLATSGSEIYLGILSAQGIAWSVVVADLPEGQFSRLAISPNGKKLALVVTPS